MKRQHNISVIKATNGFLIRSVPDEPRKNEEFVAKDEQEAIERVKQVADEMFVTEEPTGT